MRIISRSLLREFWRSRDHDTAIAERELVAWYHATKPAIWKNHNELLQTFGTADRMGDCTVFRVGDRRYRVLGRVMYKAGLVYVLAVSDLQE